MKIQLAYASLQAISFASARRYTQPEYMKDLYDHKSVENWRTYYDVYRSEQWHTQSVSSEENPVENLQAILDNQDYVVLDVRTDQEVEDASWNFADMDIKAKYGKFVYNDVKVNPSLLIKSLD